MKRNVKVRIVVLSGILLCCSLCACGKGQTDKGGSDNSTEVEDSGNSEAKGNYDVFECIKKINPDDTLEEVNKIIGFEGENISKSGGKVYYWQLTENTGVRVQYCDSGNSQIEIDFKNKSIADGRNDFSKFSEIKKKLNAGETLTYDEFVKIIGGVEGVLESKSSYDCSYTWVNDKGGYLMAQFETKTMKCKGASGMF